MARIELPALSAPCFRTILDLRISDMNYAGHMGNDASLKLAQEVRLQFLASMDCSEMDIFGSGLIVADAAIQFQKEAFHGDRLEWLLEVCNFSRCGCEMVYQATRLSDNACILSMKTGIVFFDYATRKTQAVPEQFKQQCQLMSQGG